MADEKSIPPQEDSKKDTVRINLPPVTHIGTAPPGGPATVKLSLSPTGGPIQTPEEKEATAIIGKTPPIARVKADTSQVDMGVGKRPVAPTPRPTVKLRREPEPVAAAPAVDATASVAAPGVVSESGDSENGLAIAAMALALVVMAYLAYVVVFA